MTGVAALATPNEIDYIWAKLSELTARLERHLGECSVRHQEIIRRQDEGSADRTNMRNEIVRKLDELEQKFDDAHAVNVSRMHSIERKGSERWLSFAAASIAVAMSAAIAYFIK